MTSTTLALFPHAPIQATMYQGETYKGFSSAWITWFNKVTLNTTTVNNIITQIIDNTIDWTDATQNFSTTGTLTFGGNTYIQQATKPEMLADSSTWSIITPSVIRYHPGIAKAWVRFAGTSTILGSYNVASITDNGTGDFTITFTTAFEDANYAIAAFAGTDSTAGQKVSTTTTGAAPTTTACRIKTGQADLNGDFTAVDFPTTTVVFYGGHV